MATSMSTNVHDWTPSQRKFMEWLATPSDWQQPLSQKALAKELGVNEKTLCRWKQLPGFIAEVNQIVDEHLGDDYAEIAGSLKREARRGSFPHQKMYFEMIGKYVQRAIVDHNHMITQEAQRVADALGVPVEEVIAEAERIVAEAA